MIENKVENKSDRNTYELIDNNNELACLVNMDISKKIKELISFGRKFNPRKKSFLSVFSCKFKKSRMQEQESKIIHLIKNLITNYWRAYGSNKR